VKKGEREREREREAAGSENAYADISEYMRRMGPADTRICVSMWLEPEPEEE